MIALRPHSPCPPSLTVRSGVEVHPDHAAGFGRTDLDEVAGLVDQPETSSARGFHGGGQSPGQRVADPAPDPAPRRRTGGRCTTSSASRDRQAPRATWDKPLAESAPRTHHGVTIVGVKRAGEDFTYARPETVINRHDQLIVSGPTQKVEKYCSIR